MAWTRTDIGNLALRRLGISQTMTDVDTDTDTRAKAVRAVLDLAVQRLLSEYHWPMAERMEELGLVDGSEDEPYNDDWTFAYRYSTTWMKFIRVVDPAGGDRNPTQQSMIPYKTFSDTSGRLILTDLEDAEAEVIVIPEEGMYPAAFVEALSIKTAMLAGPSLEGDTKGGQDLEHDYETAIAHAKVIAATEAGYELPRDTPAIQARRGSGYRRGGTWRSE
jgi:hypothetical protein